MLSVSGSTAGVEITGVFAVLSTDVLTAAAHHSDIGDAGGLDGWSSSSPDGNIVSLQVSDHCMHAMACVACIRECSVSVIIQSTPCTIRLAMCALSEPCPESCRHSVQLEAR